MRMFASLALAAALLACAPPVAEKKTEEGVAPSAAAGIVGTKMKPGEWRTSVTMLEMSVPGMPAGVAVNQQPIVSTECVSAQEIDKFIGKRSAGDDSSNCSFTDIKASAGHIEGTGSCTGGGARTMTMSGDYGESRVDVAMTVAGDTPRGPMTAKMRMLSERLGDCKG